jgi:transcriptional regulator with XRE-family HTH domain
VTGTQVRELRLALKMEPAYFAQLLGVHPSTLYRWEAATSAGIRVEPFQQQILAVLQRELGLKTQQAEDLGEAILKGLLVGGAMLGLFKLLEAAFSEEPRRIGREAERGTSPSKRRSPSYRQRRKK